jgi:hypothetical protein
MPSLSETYITSVDLTIRAVDKIHKQTGSRETIARTSISGGAAVPQNIDRSSSSISESGKGGKLNISG